MQATKETTTADVQLAIRNAEKMHGKYIVNDDFPTGDLFVVQNIEDGSRCYAVTTIPGLERCSCKQFEKAGVCKHQVFIDEYIKIKAEETKLADPDYVGFMA